MPDTCIFCAIAAGDIPCKKVYEDSEFIAFFDAFPTSLGHTLIIPKAHAANVFELDEAAAGRLFALAVRLAKKLQAALNCDGMNILQNNGEAAGQTVFHFHLHLVPRYRTGDNVNFSWKTITPTAEEADALIAKLSSV